jgi:hypothetical protein
MGDSTAVLQSQHIEGFGENKRKRSLQTMRLFFHRENCLSAFKTNDVMIPFLKSKGKGDLSTVKSRRAVRKLAERLFIQDGVV